MPGLLFERDYAVYGLRLRVQCSDPAVDEVVSAMLVHLRLAPVKAASPDRDLLLTVRVEAHPSSVPPDAVFVIEADRGIGVWKAGGLLYLHSETTTAQLDPASGTGTVSLHAGTDADLTRRRAALFDALTLSLLILLRHRDRYMVHAAALVRGEAGYLLVGKSHSGKSTLAFSLVRQGWGYLSDDMVLLCLEEGRIEAMPLGRDFRLTPESVRLFPELDVSQTTGPGGDGKWHIDVEALYPSQFAACCIPRVLLFPEIMRRDESELLPLGRTEALLHLISQTTFVSPASHLAARQLDVLKRLVNQAHAYRLLAGQDLRSDPTLFAKLLARISIAAGSTSR